MTSSSCIPFALRFLGWLGFAMHTQSFLTGDIFRRSFLPIGCFFQVPTSAPHSGFILNSSPQRTALWFPLPSVFFPFPSLRSLSSYFNPSWIPASGTHTWNKMQSNNQRLLENKCQLKKKKKKRRRKRIKKNMVWITNAKSSLSTLYGFSVLFQFYAPLCFLASGARGDDCIQGAVRKAARCSLPHTVVRSAVCCKGKEEVILGGCCYKGLRRKKMRVGWHC